MYTVHSMVSFPVAINIVHTRKFGTYGPGQRGPRSPRPRHVAPGGLLQLEGIILPFLTAHPSIVMSPLCEST